MTNDNETPWIQLDGPYLDILSLRGDGLCCSQIVVKLILKDLGRDNPDLVRAMAALCFGSGGSCGVLTGALCALSAGLEGGPDRERPDPLLPLLVDELVGWFSLKTERAYGGSSCERILEASPDKRACTMLMIATLEKLLSMLASTGNPEKGHGHGHP